MTKLVTLSEHDLRQTLDNKYTGLTNDQKTRIVNAIMVAESTRTPRQVKEIETLRNRISYLQTIVKRAAELLDKATAQLDRVFSVNPEDEESEDEDE